MSTASDLGNVQRQAAHPLGVGDVLHGTKDCSQVSRDGCLQRQQDKGGFLRAGLHACKVFVIANYFFGNS
jgi:hypothetical protein